MDCTYAKKQMERRRFPRLSTTSDSALVMLPEENLSGALVDISMGGLSFLYSGNPFHLADMLQRGILIGEDDLWLENIPIKTVHDFEARVPLLTDEPGLRRRCLQFCGLSEAQRTLVEQFIWLNT